MNKNNWKPERRPERSPTVYATVVRSALMLITIGWLHVAVAQEPDDENHESETVVFDASALCGEPDEIDEMTDQLLIRLPGRDLVRGRSESLTSWTIHWEPEATGGCNLELTTPTDVYSLPLGPEATPEARRDAIIRIAWWIETAPSEDELEQIVSSDTEAEPVDEPPIVDTNTAPPQSQEEPEPFAAPFNLLTSFGATYFPTASEASGVFRLFFAVPVSTHIQLGVEGRLGTELAVPSPNQETDYLERSIAVLARHLSPLSENWMFDMSAGVRTTFANLEVEGELDADARIPSTLSNWVVFAGVGGGYALTESVRLRADVVGGIALDNRQIQGPAGLLSDLGVLSIDMSLGVELSY